ncbi:hypothetical protein LEP1GSC198_2747 [Leptospira kirschneri str. JB]|nr:hypothetical protein LEP1GSC198_2747 [Leptospira kirschneri str. JB]
MKLYLRNSFLPKIREEGSQERRIYSERISLKFREQKTKFFGLAKILFFDKMVEDII